MTRENIATLVLLRFVGKDMFKVNEVAAFLGITDRAAREIMRYLRERQLVEYLGGAFYQVINLNDKAIEVLNNLIEITKEYRA